MKNEQDEIKPEATVPTKPEATKGIVVTATRTVDFPSLDWAIKAGEVRELPADAEAQAVILANSHIQKVKN